MDKERKLLLRICEAWINSANTKGEFDETCVPRDLRQEVFDEIGLGKLEVKCLRDCEDGIYVIEEIARVTDLKCYRNKESNLVIEGNMSCKKCGSIMFGSKVAV